jgi:hypothetical protein
MKLYIISYALYSIIVSFLGCGSNGEDHSSNQVVQTSKVEATSTQSQGEFDKISNIDSTAGPLSSESQLETYRKDPAKIIKDAFIRMRVENYQESLSKVRGIIDNNKGYIADEAENRLEYEVRNTIKIRVPSPAFEKTLNELSSVALVINEKGVNAKDVTEEFIDISSRLKTRRDVLNQYSELLKRAKTIDEIIAVEENIRKIQEEIESAEGRLKYLSDQVSYSSIELTIFQQFEYLPKDDRPGFFFRIWTAFHNGWEGMLTFIIFLVNLWAFWLITGVVLFILYRIFGKKVFKKM